MCFSIFRLAQIMESNKYFAFFALRILKSVPVSHPRVKGCRGMASKVLSHAAKVGTRHGWVKDKHKICQRSYNFLGSFVSVTLTQYALI